MIRGKSWHKQVHWVKEGSLSTHNSAYGIALPVFSNPFRPFSPPNSGLYRFKVCTMLTRRIRFVEVGWVELNWGLYLRERRVAGA